MKNTRRQKKELLVEAFPGLKHQGQPCRASKKSSSTWEKGRMRGLTATGWGEKGLREKKT